MRKEIEVKAKINNVAEIEEKISALGVQFSAPLRQEDEIFINFDIKTFGDFQSGINLLRIRKTNDESIFTIKQPQSNEFDSIEHETKISNPDEMKEALKLMGYKSAVQVKKTRKTAKYKDFEICLDFVEDLGDFIEVEKIAGENADSGQIQNELFEFLLNLGIRNENRVTQGYDTLIFLKEAGKLN